MMMQVCCIHGNREIRAGVAVIATQGHDQGRLYLVIKKDRNLVLLSDGDYRPVTKLKQKNLKHLIYVKELIDSDLLATELEARKCDREKDIYIRQLLKQVECN